MALELHATKEVRNRSGKDDVVGLGRHDGCCNYQESLRFLMALLGGANASEALRGGGG